MNILKSATKQKTLLARSLWPLACVLALTSLPFASHAAVYNVDNGSDDTSNYSDGSSLCGNPCTLRSAIRAANASAGADEINILAGIDVALNENGAANVDENSAKLDDLDITGDLTIVGANNASRNIIDATGIGGTVGGRVFHIINATVEFQNVSIKNGHLTIQVDANDKIIGNPAGAGIFIEGTSSYVTLDNVEVTNNTITTSSAADFTTVGGGIYVADQATIIINDSEITYNQAPSGGGINNAGRADIRRTLIDWNKATDTNDPLSGSVSGGGGGGINNQGGYLSLGESTLSNNTSTQLGGGMYFANLGQNNGNVIITNSVIHKNLAEFGGAGVASFGPLTITNSAITENSSHGIITAGSRGNGSGILNSGLGSLDMVNSTVSHNIGAHSGGGIFSSRDINLTNVTIYDNEADSCVASADCVENSQIGGNQIALYTSSDSRPNMVLSNSIIGNGPNSNAGEPPCAGSTGYTNDIKSQGYNMESGDSCGLDLLPPTTDQSFANYLDMHLEALNNDPSPPAGIQPIGGQAAASLVHALQTNSPAIDKGSNDSCPLVDQRFMLRDDKCDIGAYEEGATTQLTSNLVDLKATITDTPDPVAPNNTQQPLTYIVTVSNLYVDTPANDVFVYIYLPTSFSYSNITVSATGTDPICSSPSANNIITCTAGSILGLGRVEFFISGYPTVAGTITAKVDVISSTQDAFQQNNLNITEDTVIDPEAGNVTNFGGGSGGGGGGGTPHPFTLLLTALLLLGRRFRTFSPLT